MEGAVDVMGRKDGGVGGVKDAMDHGLFFGEPSGLHTTDRRRISYENALNDADSAIGCIYSYYTRSRDYNSHTYIHAEDRETTIQIPSRQYRLQQPHPR